MRGFTRTDGCAHTGCVVAMDQLCGKDLVQRENGGLRRCVYEEFVSVLHLFSCEYGSSHSANCGILMYEAEEAVCGQIKSIRKHAATLGRTS